MPPRFSLAFYFICASIKAEQPCSLMAHTIEPFPEKAQAVLDALYKAVEAKDALQRLEYLRDQQKSFVSVLTDEEELFAREFFYLTKIGLLD